MKMKDFLQMKDKDLDSNYDDFANQQQSITHKRINSRLFKRESKVIEGMFTDNNS